MHELDCSLGTRLLAVWFEVGIASGALQAHHCSHCALSSRNSSPSGELEAPPIPIGAFQAETVKKGSPPQNEISFKVLVFSLSHYTLSTLHIEEISHFDAQ